MQVKQFIDGMTPSTAGEYRTTYKYFKDWKARKKLFSTFADFLLSIEMAQATRIKHLRQARCICEKCDTGVSAESKEYKRLVQ